VSIITNLVEINGNKIELLQKGNHGTPVIILTGMGCSFDEWYEVTEQLSNTNRIIMFHRQGLGGSELVTKLQNTEATVRLLMDVILHLKLLEPFILVGHSYGGLCAQHFVKLYPQHIKGLVLIDSTSVDFNELNNLNLPALNKDSSDEVWLEKCKLYSKMNIEELRKIINPSLTEKQQQLPNAIQRRLIDFQINPTLYKAMYSEIKNWKKDAEIIKNLGDFPNIPLMVIGRDKEYSIKLDEEEGFPEWELRVYEDKWQELIINQANLSTKGELIFAEQASHLVYLDRPDIVIKAVNKIDDQ
jgi:pimeloyl-ACP methyl ester carboxylesterase